MKARVTEKFVAVQRSISRFIVGEAVLPRAPRFPKKWEASVDEGFMAFPRDGVDDVRAFLNYLFSFGFFFILLGLESGELRF